MTTASASQGGPYRAYLVAARGALGSHGRVRGRARQKGLGAIGHALAFGTWRALACEQELTDSPVADLMCRLIAVVADSSGRHTTRRFRRFNRLPQPTET